MLKIKRKHYESSSSERECEQKKRGKRFSQIETDLLLSLLMSSNISNTDTSRMTPKGRTLGWESITKYFNASADVVQRTEKELRDRASNIRKDLYRLSRYEKEMMQATGGDNQHPPRKAPSVSFDFSNVVKKYANALQVKLVGLSNTVENISVQDCLMPESNHSSNSFDNELKPTLDATLSLHDDEEMTLASNEPSLCLPHISSVMYSNVSQRRRKRNADDIQRSNCNNSGISPTTDVLRKKSQLLAGENKRRNEENDRRNEWHFRCMEIKNEELVIKRKQSEFWTIMIDKLKQDSISISDIANVARVIENPINYDYPSGSLSSTEQCAQLDNFTKIGAETHFDDSSFEISKEKDFPFIKTENG